MILQRWREEDLAMLRAGQRILLVNKQLKISCDNYMNTHYRVRLISSTTFVRTSTWRKNDLDSQKSVNIELSE